MRMTSEIRVIILEGDQMPPQAQAIELLCRCDDIPDDGVELRVLKGLLTAATSSATHLHGQVCVLPVYVALLGYPQPLDQSTMLT